MDSKENEWVLNKAGVKRELLDTVKARQLKHTRSHREETSELPGERDNAMNNARGTQARKATHGLDRQHQDVGRTEHLQADCQEPGSYAWVYI